MAGEREGDDAFLRHRESEYAISVATKKLTPATTSFLVS